MKFKRTIIVSMLAFSLAACVQTRNASPSAINAVETSVNSPINASAIWNKYDKDPNKRRPTHRGATETATGVVTYIGQDSHGTPSMELSDTAGGRSYVLGVFGSYDEMAAVSVGDTVTILGSFHIMSSENMVVLKRCEILAVS